MSYLLSAQRVSGTKGEGVNVTLYRRRGDLPREGGCVDVTQAFDFDGGLVARAHEVPPGGNNVRSYVDVVLARPDPGLLDQVVDLAKVELKRRSPPLRVPHEDAALELNMEFGLHLAAAQELDELVRHAKPMLARADEELVVPVPLRIRVRSSADQLRAFLDPEDEARLRRHLPPDWAPSSLTLESPGDLDLMLPHLALITTHLDAGTLADHGGASFIDDDTGHVLGTWPPRGTGR